MCLVLIAWRVHPRYPLIVAANRDDLERPPGFMGGARGRGEGAYILDPSGNRIELRTYRP